MRGEVGTKVQISVRRAGTVRPVTLRRGELAASDVLVDRPARGVVRIRVAAFTRGVGREVRAAVATAHDERAGVILDLRGNPGGLLVEGVEVASAFLSDGVVVSYRRRGAPEEVHRVVSTGDTTTSLVVLIDGGTASAAEVVAAALQDRERGVLVGSRTYGKGSVQQPVRLADGTALEFTIARYHTPDGRSIEGAGVRPDIDVESSATDDMAIRRAVEVLDGILADIGTPRG
jgi:carboxyl-terminal processing protease